MKQLISILFLLCLSSAYAGKSAVEVIPGDHPADDHMVKWSDGSVSFIKPEKAIFIDVKPVMLQEKFFTDELAYEPTVLESEAAAQSLLRKQKKPNFIQWNIQCYNMAHVRAYEAWKYQGVKSMKMFLFFTNSYIRKYGSKWWFHVTPLVHVNVNGKTEERILDREWAKKPLAIKEWTDKFIKSKAACPVIKKYSAYEDHQDTSDCYVFPTNMYYWQPLHLIESERSGIQRTNFIMSEVNTAYARDF